jgi:hypothetical protein
VGEGKVVKVQATKLWFHRSSNYRDSGNHQASRNWLVTFDQHGDMMNLLTTESQEGGYDVKVEKRASNNLSGYMVANMMRLSNEQRWINNEVTFYQTHKTTGVWSIL